MRERYRRCSEMISPHFGIFLEEQLNLKRDFDGKTLKKWKNFKKNRILIFEIVMTHKPSGESPATAETIVRHADLKKINLKKSKNRVWDLGAENYVAAPVF